MHIMFCIPTYWARAANVGHRQGDTVYDHPTPIDAPGTLERTLESFLTLRDHDWSIHLIVSTTTPEIDAIARQRVLNIIHGLPAKLQSTITFAAAAEVEQLQHLLVGTVGFEFLSLVGYPAVRNIGLLAATIAQADPVVMVDDDQVFEDPDFVLKVREGMQWRVGGAPMLGWSGYCPEAHGGYRRVRAWEPWMEFWDKISAQNSAYDALIGVAKPRFKLTPLGFGGCLVLRQALFSTLPFDPNVGRGEDMDYVMNARMFGHPFYLDNQLFMRHLPPPRSHPQWRRFREDMLRFLYQREKLRCQGSSGGTVRLTASDLSPYPGGFLTEELDRMILRASTSLTQQYTAAGDEEGAARSRENLTRAREQRFLQDPFLEFIERVKAWEGLLCVLTQQRQKFQFFLAR